MLGEFRLADRLKSDVQALIDGYKPSIISERGKAYEDLKKRYPYICPFIRSEPESLIFFQTDRHKGIYEERMKNVLEGSTEFEYILGTSLGFPEKSVRWFAKIMEKKRRTGKLPPEKKLYGTGVYWAGFSFSTNIEYLDHEVQSIWDTYNHPKANDNSLFLFALGCGKYEIPHSDLDQVRLVQREVLAARNLLPVLSND